MSKPGSIEDLARRAASGDRRAFEDLVVRYRLRLEALVRSRLGQQVRQHVDVEDIVQETFAKALECIGGLTWLGERAFFGWLASIAQNLMLSASQKASRTPLQLVRDVPARSGSPSKNLRRQERFDRLDRALACLSEDHRRAIVLARIEKLQISEIAERMNRSPNAVKKLLARALQELRKEFGDTESLRLPPDRLSFGDPHHDD